MKDKPKIICTKCSRDGFLTERWVRSSYRPKYFSELCESLHYFEILLSVSPSKKDEEIQVGTSLRLTKDMIPIEMKLGDYVATARVRISGSRYSQEINDRDAYRVRSKKKYHHYYIGHYDPAKYLKEMTAYRKGERKSRPNGRVWCKLPKGTDINSLMISK